MLDVARKDNGVYILYSARNWASGRTVTYDVYDNSNTQTVTGATLTEIGTTGTYGGSFTPTTVGDYKVVLFDNGVTRASSYVQIAEDDIESIGAKLDTLLTDCNLYTGFGL